MKLFSRHRILERSIATASFLVAVALAFISLLIAHDNEIASGNLMTIAQFLTFSATLLGIDYKFATNGQTTATPKEYPQQ